MSIRVAAIKIGIAFVFMILAGIILAVVVAPYHRVPCDDIVQDLDGNIVCEVTLKTPTDNILIYRGN